MIKLNDNLSEDYSLETQMEIFKEKTGHDFLTFYKKYLPKLVYHNNKYLRDEAVAEDIAMDAILKSLKKIDDYNPEKARYSTWLFTISKNECIQYLNKNNKMISVDKFVDEEGTTIKDFLPDTGSEDQYMLDIENLNVKKGKLVESKIEELKDPYKKVIKLRHFEKKSYREITIILREKEKLTVTNSFFDPNHYQQFDGISYGVLSLVDPEKKKNDELVKFYSIKNISDNKGNKVDFRVIERDKDGLISKIAIPKGNFTIEGEVPFNMSTLKSQIRNGRLNLRDMVKKDFENLDRFFL